MARRITQKELKHDEFVDAAFDFGHWLEENWPTVLKWTAAGLVVVLGVVGWAGYASRSASKTRALLARGVTQYQQADLAGFTDSDQVSSVLDTFQQVDERAGSSSPARVARYLEGATLFRLGRLDEAATALGDVCADPADTICASAQMLLARVHAGAGRVDEAVGVLEQIARDERAVIPTDRVLLETGRLLLDAGRADEARRRLQRVVNEFPSSLSAAEARELLR